MLSRLAESFFWLSRNVERAETVARVLDVAYTRAIGVHGADAWSERLWRSAAAIGTFTNVEDVEIEEPAALWALRRCAFDLDNPSSISSSIGIARSNAVGVRAELSTEAWEHLNDLYLDIRGQTFENSIADGPSRLLRRVRDRCQAIAGVSDATLLHVDGWNFLVLGRFVERALLATRMIATMESFDDPWPEWQRLLEMCCASMPFARAATQLPSPRDAVSFILFNTTFPRSLAFCANEIDAALHRISETHRAYANEAEKHAGRLRNVSHFSDIGDVQSEGLHVFLGRVENALSALVIAIEATFYPKNTTAAATMRQNDAYVN